MNFLRVDFSRIRWKPSATMPRMRERSKILGSKKFRLIELLPGFNEKEWCLKGHTAFVVEGEFQTRVRNRTYRWTKQSAFQIIAGTPHKSINPGRRKAVLFLVEDVPIL